MLNPELIGILYALKHARRTIRKSAHVHVATMSRNALETIQKGHGAIRGRAVLHCVANTIGDLGSVGHRVTIFLVPADRSIRGVEEPKATARAITTEDSTPKLPPSERVRELCKVLLLIDQERSKRLRLCEDDVRVRYYTWKLDRAHLGSTLFACTEH